jgi:hypothetical protein
MPLTASGEYALKEIEEASGVEISSKRLIEVPIIDNVGERAQFATIMKSFGVMPERFPTDFWPWWQRPGYDRNKQHGTEVITEGINQPGSVIWRPFEGLPPDVDPKEFLEFPGWDYIGFLKCIIDLLNECVDTAIYVHCQLGADRTGAFHIGYLMKSKGLSLEEASRIANSSTSAGPPNADYQRLVEAYSVINCKI